MTNKEAILLFFKNNKDDFKLKYKIVTLGIFGSFARDEQLSETFMLDPQMRDRLAKLNPTASARVANRLLEASDRNFWKPDAKMLDALRRAGEELEDRLEGVFEGAPA